MYGEEINQELNNFFQEYFVKPQLINSGHDDEYDQKKEGLKRAIQKCFIQYHILEFDNMKAFLEDNKSADKIYEALSKKESREVANEIFNNAINEVKEIIAGEFGMAPRRKKEYEILAEELEKKYGEKSIDNNVNRVISKGGSIGDSCSDGGCGCC